MLLSWGQVLGMLEPLSQAKVQVMLFKVMNLMVYVDHLRMAIIGGGSSRKFKCSLLGLWHLYCLGSNMLNSVLVYKRLVDLKIKKCCICSTLFFTWNRNSWLAFGMPPLLASTMVFVNLIVKLSKPLQCDSTLGNCCSVILIKSYVLLYSFWS